MKYYSVVTATVSLLLSLYLTYYTFNLYEINELIDLLKSKDENLIIKNDCSTEINKSLNTNQKIYLCVGIWVILIGIYFYTLNDIPPITDFNSALDHSLYMTEKLLKNLNQDDEYIEALDNFVKWIE